MELNTGISQEDRQSIAAGLARLLADSYTLYLKTHNYHWNVTGPQFNTLHLMFEGQYTELATAVDDMAERIRAPAPGSYTAFAQLATVREETGSPSATEMINTLVDDQAKIVASAGAVIEAADAAGDQASVDLGVRRTDVHEKNAWMLRSHLE